MRCVSVLIWFKIRCLHAQRILVTLILLSVISPTILLSDYSVLFTHVPTMATVRNTNRSDFKSILWAHCRWALWKRQRHIADWEETLSLPMWDDHSVATVVFFHWMHTAVGNWKLKGFLYLGGKNRASVIGMQQHPSLSAYDAQKMNITLTLYTWII